MAITHRLPRNTPEQAPFYRRFMYLPLLVVAAGAVFLPALGPFLDHHFAERHPHHDHVFLGPQAPSHLHFYEEIRGHSHALSRESSAPKDVVYLTSQHGVGQSLPHLPATPPGKPIIAFPEPEYDSILLGTDGQVSFLKESFVAPDDKPPRG